MNTISDETWRPEPRCRECEQLAYGMYEVTIQRRGVTYTKRWPLCVPCSFTLTSKGFLRIAEGQEREVTRLQHVHKRNWKQSKAVLITETVKEDIVWREYPILQVILKETVMDPKIWAEARRFNQEEAAKRIFGKRSQSPRREVEAKVLPTAVPIEGIIPI